MDGNFLEPGVPKITPFRNCFKRVHFYGPPLRFKDIQKAAPVNLILFHIFKLFVLRSVNSSMET